jgi:hypothetical protein
MDTVKSEQSSEDEVHPLDIEPQFVDMKHEEFSEPFVAIDKFEAEVGYMVVNIKRFGWKFEYHVQYT